MGCFGKKKKQYKCTVVLLDETDIVHEIKESTRGQDLMEVVFKHLNLLETSYFGLRYLEKTGESRWLDPVKKITKQIKGLSAFTFYFGVKFYASDPCKLQEEITRYQFVLQLKQDILQGRLIVSFDLAAELFALSLQSELGDYDSRRHDKQYVSEFRFLPNQTPELEEKVVQIHKSLTGQVPSVVEMTFLERVKWLDMYGVDLHVVMGEDNVEYFLCLTPSGVAVMKNKVKISNYFWPRITKVFFKGKYFMLRVKDKMNDENTYAFELPSKQACKYLWKCCIEHHAFFRLTQVKELSNLPLNIFSLGSKHRYSGRTEQQLKMELKQIKRPPPAVVRVPSKRYPKRLGQPDGADAETNTECTSNVLQLHSKDDLSLPVTTCSSPLYRSISTPAELSAIDTIKVIKSAPWEDPEQKGLFTNSSRQSLQSSINSEKRYSHRSHSRRRSPSVDSENSLDYRRRRHHRSKRSSDNDSDISKSSRGSRGSRSSRGSNSHRKTRSHNREGSDSDSCHKRRGRRHSNRRSENKYDLIESESQWKMVQKQQQINGIRLQSAVVRDLSHKKSGYMNSGADTESEITTHYRKKYRRHSRSRSRSPDPKHPLPNEVKKHIEYNLIDAADLTEAEKRDIKYTKIETESDVYRVHYSPVSGKPRYKVAKIPSRTSLERLHSKKSMEDDPPPPYVPNNAALQHNGNISPDQMKQTGWEQNVSSPHLTAYSSTPVSDSSTSSHSSVLKSRSEIPLSHSGNLGITNYKGKNAKYHNGSLLELSSTQSSGTESNSQDRFVNNSHPSKKEEIFSYQQNFLALSSQDIQSTYKQSKQMLSENHQCEPMKVRNKYEMSTEL